MVGGKACFLACGGGVLREARLLGILGVGGLRETCLRAREGWVVGRGSPLERGVAWHEFSATRLFWLPEGGHPNVPPDVARHIRCIR